MFPDFKHWASVVLEATAFLSVFWWALRGLIRDAQAILVEIRKRQSNDITKIDRPPS